jgi:hypothetical protein
MVEEHNKPGGLACTLALPGRSERRLGEMEMIGGGALVWAALILAWLSGMSFGIWIGRRTTPETEDEEWNH